MDRTAPTYVRPSYAICAELETISRKQIRYSVGGWGFRSIDHRKAGARAGRKMKYDLSNAVNTLTNNDTKCSSYLRAVKLFEFQTYILNPTAKTKWRRARLFAAIKMIEHIEAELEDKGDKSIPKLQRFASDKRYIELHELIEREMGAGIEFATYRRLLPSMATLLRGSTKPELSQSALISRIAFKNEVAYAAASPWLSTWWSRRHRMKRVQREQH
jgi:hypothetical protein